MNNRYFWLTVFVLLLIGFITFIVYKQEPALPAPIDQTVIIPIEPTGTTDETLTVNVFFPNSVIDPGFLDCSVVRPTKRTIPYTLAVANASINELIKGLTLQEIKNGFQTVIDPQAKIKSLSIVNGTAVIDFTKELNNKNVGLCAGQFIEAQIKQTLLQFPTVQKVTITIEGKGDFVQP